ncbi:hypothetical protein BCR42DRAFT_323265 [Absidia repens]|uniref:Uncharacterized protein n=1 Tax=Absidia repens TaxID=90262 RepID=A0A1X2INI1_9FUNG|nr:hypothetical protein BCR42DRAFT_323265 [Absidia repens]
MDGLLLLTHVLRPEVLVHVSLPSSSTYESLSLAYGTQEEFTLIHLPSNQVHHALWIADLSLNALKHWNSISIQLVIITDRRPHSFSRLLQTCGKSYFLGDQVDLTINMEQSADKVTRNLVNSFDWVYGSKTVRHRIQKGGLMPAIVESWYPRSNDDYAVLLEDDISVSPLFYTWAKYNILKYRYGDEKHQQQQQQQHIYGISLYSPRNVELHLVGRRPFDPNQVLADTGYPARTPYASQIPCSWGAVYFPEHWREFHQFLSAQLEDLATNQYLNISLPMSRSDRWKKSWKKYFIQLVYLRGYVMIYPNFQSYESFATNHLEMGTHVKSEKRVNIISTFLVPLMQRDTLLHQLPNRRLPDFDQLPVLDLWGHLVDHDILDERAAAWHPRISACRRRIGLTFTPDDLLCPFTNISAWDRPDTPVTTKKIKVLTMTELVEPLAYVTAPAMPSLLNQKVDNDELDWPLSIDVALMAPPLVDNTSLVETGDDQWEGLHLELASLLSTRGPLNS